MASEKEDGVFARLRLGRSSGACEGEGGVFAGLCLVQKWRSLRELPPPREQRRSLRETPPAEAGRSLRAVESQLTSQKNGAQRRRLGWIKQRRRDTTKLGGWVTNERRQTKIDDKF